MRDYSTISPSAKGLLLMKSLTDIPFVADIVKMIETPAAVLALKNRLQDDLFLRRLIHFEARYRSLDSLLQELSSKHILEIASGFSFRGLDLALRDPDVFYMDTDLPEVLNLKADLTLRLIEEQQLELQGELLTLPMNVLDELNVRKNINLMPPGPTTFINEGLLVYLTTGEKTQLCEIIHHILSERGGYWLTADIYIKRELPRENNDKFSAFLQSHNVEDQKFESFEQAEDFFDQRGFKIHKKAGPVWHSLSSMKYIPETAMPALIDQATKIGKVRETWALVVK